MQLNDRIQYYQENFKVVDTVFLSGWHPGQWINQWTDFKQHLSTIRKESFDVDERILFVVDTDDYDKITFENFFKKFIHMLFDVDISNCFVVVLTNNNVDLLFEYFQKYSSDKTIPTIDTYNAISKKHTASADTFCVLPWTHLMITPYHEIKTCCLAIENLGRIDQVTMKDVWNNDAMIEIRQSLLHNSYHTNCSKCYETESHGNISPRKRHNKDFEIESLKIQKDRNTVLDKFELKYFDLRFTNLCNIRCRTCNHHSSSKWFADEVKLDPDYNKPVLMKAGKTENDVWEQIHPHLDYVEQIYFAGGEPLIMDEHYWILDALEKQQRYDVKIFYNTNFTKIKLKDRSVFDYWKRFNNVSVGASLDASGKRGEYIRKDSDWSEIENNRRAMLEICPNTKFTISATASILNIWHLSDFHREWVEKGLIRPQDFQINFVQEPGYYRIDIATPDYKDLVKKKILQHCEWLMRFSDTEEIHKKYISTINFMLATDNTQYIPEFWKKTKQLDQIRNESILEILPELTSLVLKGTGQYEA